MKRKIAKALSVMVLGAAVFSFAACQGNTSTDGSADKSTEESSDTSDLVTDVSDEELVSDKVGADLMSGIHHAEIEFEDGGIVYVELDADSAPITVTNFVGLCNDGFYDGLVMHRAVKDFVLQGGDPLGTGAGGSENNIPGEFEKNGYDNDLKHTRGAISMARARDYDSASSQFFIVQEDADFLDGEYACFGYVTDGMDIIDDYINNCSTVDQNGTIAEADRPVIKTIRITD